MFIALFLTYFLLSSAVLHHHHDNDRINTRVKLLICAAISAVWIATTYLACLRPGIFAPVWVEDTFLTGASFLVISSFFFASRKHAAALIFVRITALLIFLILTCATASALFTKLTKNNPVALRQHIETNMHDLGYRLFVKPLPDAARQDIMHRQKVTIESEFGLTDHSIIPRRNKQPGEIRVMWLGDSVLKGDGVPRDQRFVSLLDKDSDARNLVAAQSSLSTNIERMIFSRFSRVFDPDIVITAIFPFNDCHELRQTYNPHLGITVYYDGAKKDYLLLDSPSLRKWETGFILQPPSFALQYAAMYSPLGAYILQLHNYSVIRHSYYRTQNELSKIPGYTTTSIPPIDSQLATLFSDIRATGATPAAIILPYNRRHYPADSAQSAESNACAARVRHYLADSGIPYMDMDAAFSHKSSPAIPQSLFAPDHVHLSLSGNRLAAAAAKPFLDKLRATHRSIPAGHDTDAYTEPKTERCNRKRSHWNSSFEKRQK